MGFAGWVVSHAMRCLCSKIPVSTCHRSSTIVDTNEQVPGESGAGGGNCCRGLRTSFGWLDVLSWEDMHDVVGG